jgi:hypothetical protein
MSHRISAARRPSSGVFFNGSPLLFGVSQLPIAELFGYAQQLLNELTEAVVFLQLLAGLLHGGSGWDDAGHRFARHRMGQRITRAMALGSFLSTATGGFTAFAKARHQGTGTHFPNLR